MAKRAAVITLAMIPLDPSSNMPLYRQLYSGVRRAILAGKIAAGARLPSTRALAMDLSLSRTTVMNAPTWEWITRCGLRPFGASRSPPLQ